IDQFVSVGADIVSRDASDEGCSTSIAQAIPDQRATRFSASRPATASCRPFVLLQVVDRSRGARAEIRILPLRDALHVHDALLQSVEVDLDIDWRTRRPRGLIVRAAAPSTTTCASRRRIPDALVLVALRKQRARLALFQNREIQAEIL